MVVFLGEDRLTDTGESKKPYRILSLDGGGAKGFYTLGVLSEIESLIKCPLHENSIWYSAQAPAR